MNAPFGPKAVPLTAFERELQRANEWRSESIQEFAKLEQSIADALQYLAGKQPKSKIKLTGQFRQCFEELKRISTAKGSKFEYIGKSMTEIEPYLDWRAHLTHGLMHLWVDDSGQYLITLEHRESCSGPLKLHSIRRNDADHLSRGLREEVERLKRRLVTMRLTFDPPSSQSLDPTDTPSA